jgi:small-conductance mechanosensitive channel
MDPIAFIRDELLTLTEESWARDLLLLIAVTLITYWPMRLPRARIQRRLQEGELTLKHVSRTIWSLLDTSIWPITSVLVLVFLDELLEWLIPEYAVKMEEVLPVLGFFLVYRVLSSLARLWIHDRQRLDRFRHMVLPLIFIVTALQQLHLLDDLVRWADQPLLKLGAQAISLLSVLFAVFLIFTFIALSRLLGDLLGSRVLPGMGLDRPLSEALGTVVRYSLVVAGFLVALETLGLALSTLQIGLGALGVGIGFGLQDLVQNFASGLILLFERTIKRGDVVSVEGESAKVLSIGLRSSVVRNRKGQEVVVPNIMLTSNAITNFSLSDSFVRMDVRVGVSYDADPREVEQILLGVAAEHPEVLKRPNPNVMFMNYGDSSIDFELRAWLDGEMKMPQVRSDLLFAIWYKLKEAQIEIPFPQRDLHLKSGGVPVFADSREEDGEDPAGRGEVH